MLKFIQFIQEITNDFWYSLNNNLSYETVIIIKNFVSVLPFMIITFVITMCCCAWLCLRIKREERIKGVSLLRIPEQSGENHYYFAEPKTMSEVLESMFTFFLWHVLFRKETIAFRDYRKSKIILICFVILVFLLIIIGMVLGFSVIWYPDAKH